jgi:hypothetical protein
MPFYFKWLAFLFAGLNHFAIFTEGINCIYIHHPLSKKPSLQLFPTLPYFFPAAGSDSGGFQD